MAVNSSPSNNTGAANFGDIKTYIFAAFSYFFLLLQFNVNAHPSAVKRINALMIKSNRIISLT
jgi:hypothetical protein